MAALRPRSTMKRRNTKKEKIATVASSNLLTLHSSWSLGA
jgi:hypothetical protein